MAAAEDRSGPRKLSRERMGASARRPLESGAVDQTRRQWIFGYGSLIFRPDIPFVDRRRALLRGWGRRFWQWSTDHRGEPWRPGRVVTLAPSPDEGCWGVAYRLDEADADSILDDLDVRERGGYVRMEVELELDGSTAGLTDDEAGRTPTGTGTGPPERVLGVTYEAWPGNRNYAGPASLAEIAGQVVAATGPSGANADYVCELDAALRALAADDGHTAELAAEVRELLAGSPGAVRSPSPR